MQILDWADHRTLIVCHCLLAAVFTVVLLILRRSYPELHCAYEEEAIDILARADSALYVAKANGRDCARLTLPVAARRAYLESETESLS